MNKRTVIALAAILLAACGGSLATSTPHPTPNPTVDPTEVTLSLTVEAIRAEPRETSEAIVNDALAATYEADNIQGQRELDQQMYDDLLTECVVGNELRTPPYPRATATAKAISCATRFLPYEIKFATETAIAAAPTPHS